ncbi:MAG: lysostaphin resistance A-like protein, partial [Halobaculum sp.]
LLFRGIVQGEVRRALGPAAAVAFASLLFGAIHYTGVSGTPGERLVYVGVAALLGCVLGVLYEYSDNLAVPALAHGSYNAVLFGIQFVGTSGL